MQAGTQEKAHESAPKNFSQPGAMRYSWLAKLIPASAIFTIAFALRYLYNAIFMEHRIAHFGDAYNFMRTGSCLLEAVTSSPDFMSFLNKIYHPVQAQAQILQSMTSMNLADRLMIDGPVFPGYLAFIEWLTGVNAANPIFDAHSVQICLCNSFVDSLTCVLVYLAARLCFERKTALTAGLLFALYPAAIINTQHCYSEPFSYFLLSCWTALVAFVLLRHQPKGLQYGLCWAGIGAFSALMLLSKPAFILLPPMVAAILIPLSLITAFKQKRLPDFFLGALKKAGLALIGLVIVLTPWVFFNKAVTGQYSVFVNRVPSFNIFHGNQIGTDAWRCYPFYGTFPGENKLVITSLIEDAKQAPIRFIGLQFKKVARLWSGVWNEYHYSLFGIPIEAQSLVHQILLLGGSLGLAFHLFRSKHKTLSRGFKAACLLGCIILFHFAYIPFEAISRYAITAMPAVVILFAALLTAVTQNKKARIPLAIAIVAGAISFTFIAQSGTVANTFASWLSQDPDSLSMAPVLALGLDCVCLLLVLVFSGKVLGALIENKTSWRFALLIPTTLSLLAASVAGFYTVQSHDWKEWQCTISPEQSVRQSIALPGTFQPTSRTAFVLIDINSNTLAAPLQVRLNGHELTDPLIPLAQLQPNNNDILQCLAIQAEGMSRDVRGFRNWWVVPCPSEVLNPGINDIELSTAEKDSGIVVYGDYQTGGPTYLPSLRSFSYTKGFTTFDHRDPRVFEKVEVEGATLERNRVSKNVEETAGDLSDARGTQSGRYRIRILVPQSGSNSNTDAASASALEKLIAEPIQLVKAEPQKVIGNNPTTFLPPQNVIQLPSNLPSGTRINFSCQTKTLSGKRPCFVSLSFTGSDSSGKMHSWTSKWQPIGIANSVDFRTTNFSDIIPDDILALSNLEIHPMFSPFQPDYLFLKKKDALKSAIEVRNAELHFLAPLDLPKVESRSWRVY